MKTKFLDKKLIFLKCYLKKTKFLTNFDQKMKNFDINNQNVDKI